MLIRKMTLEDLEMVALIEQECFSQPWSEKSFKDSIERNDTIFLVCVETPSVEEKKSSENSILGYIGMYVSFDEANITNVAVSKAARNRGCGKELVTNAKSFAKEANVANIFLEVRRSNIPAISLYKKMGFEELGIRKNFYEHPVEDAIIMKVGI